MMRKVLSLAVICTMAAPAMAWAQPEDEMEAIEVEETEVIEETVEEAPPPPEPPMVEPETAPQPPKQEADLGEPIEPQPPAEEEKTSFLDDLYWMVMASGFYNFNGYRVDGVFGPEGELIGYNNLGAPYTNYMGFGLNFAGADVGYTGEKWGVRVDLRFGSGVDQLTPLPFVKQGYVSYFPTEKLSLDLGFFDTIYGAEVVDEWNNANYTRGYLYFLRQPFNHLGVRMGAELTEDIGFTAMITNGGVLGGTTIQGGAEVPAFGWQFAIASIEQLGVYIGGQHAPNGFNGNEDWEHFFDVVLSLEASDMLNILFNADFQVDPNAPQEAGGTDTSFLHGYSLAFIVSPVDKFNIGLRGEFLDGNDESASPDYLWTATLTFRYLPVEYLVLSLEGRIEGSESDIYFNRDFVRNTEGIPVPNEDFYGAVILGASAHFGN